MKLFLITIVFCFSAFAGEFSKDFSFKDFNQAKGADSYLKFTVESTKVGLFSSDVDGYVLNYKATVSENKNELRKLLVSFPAKSMNTDHESRDEKLHNLCMGANDFPEIKVSINGPLSVNGEKQVVDALFTIRGKNKTSPISLILKREGKHIYAEGKTVLSLKEMEIPDPSIAVAKLSDDIRIEFKLDVEEQ